MPEEHIKKKPLIKEADDGLLALDDKLTQEIFGHIRAEVPEKHQPTVISFLAFQLLSVSGDCTAFFPSERGTATYQGNPGIGASAPSQYP